MSFFRDTLRARLLLAVGISLSTGACGGRTGFDEVEGPPGGGAGGSTAVTRSSPVPCVSAGACVVGEYCSTGSGTCVCAPSGVFGCGGLHLGQGLICISASSGTCPAAPEASPAIHARYSGCHSQAANQQPPIELASDGTPECCYAASIGCTGRPLEVEAELRVAPLVRGAGWAA